MPTRTRRPPGPAPEPPGPASDSRSLNSDMPGMHRTAAGPNTAENSGFGLGCVRGTRDPVHLSMNGAVNQR